MLNQFRLPDFDRQVWILAAGRLLLEIGTGFTLFYAPIFFVNQVGISATLVGVAIGSGSVSGVVGRFLGGQGADSLNGDVGDFIGRCGYFCFS